MAVEAVVLSTAGAARAAGCSAQQMRDLEAAGVIPPVHRAANGYRRFTAVHVDAVRAYRLLADAVGPTVARDLLAHLSSDPQDVAMARFSALHAGLDRDRQETLRALDAVQAIRAEHDGEEPAPAGPASADPDSMTITELAEALGVRPSTLRYWELEGLLRPERRGRQAARSYPSRAIREARIVTVLRASGQGIPATVRVMADLREHGGVEALQAAMLERRGELARRMELLLRAGTALVELRDALHED